MRLDKFLKISMIFKTRSSAEKAIDRGNVILNKKKPKSSAIVKIGDKLDVTFPLKEISYIIEDIKEKNVSKKEAKKLVTILGVKKIELF